MIYLYVVGIVFGIVALYWASEFALDAYDRWRWRRRKADPRWPVHDTWQGRHPDDSGPL